MDIKKYFNKQAGKDFSSKIEEIKQGIGCKRFDPSTSKFGIAGNTFRAFRGYNIPPSKVFLGNGQKK